ncbi:MAG: adenylosuccinate lyase [Ferrimicrobium sp.]
MIERYQSAEVTRLFSDTARMTWWRDVELAVVAAMAVEGAVDREDAESLLAVVPMIDETFVSEVVAREIVTDHDLAAFVDILQARFKSKAARWIHFGLTSSDVVDTALSLQLGAALELTLESVATTRQVIAEKAESYRDVVMLGRTHGMAAEPTTFGVKLALWALQLDRDHARLERARQGIRVGKLSGAVGTYSNVTPAIEERALTQLGLRPVPATQVIARDRHAEVVYALATTAASIETFATEIRLLQRTEVQEVQEAFAPGQKGSSAMPHKRNPILSERLCGLSRLCRSAVAPALEDIALWHERDISHSSVERVLLPDLFHLVNYMLTRFGRLVAYLDVFPDRMRHNLEQVNGLIYSQSILLALVRFGLDRDDAYRIVQRATAEVISRGIPLAKALHEDPEFPLDESEVQELCGLERLIANTGTIFEKLLEPREFRP